MAEPWSVVDENKADPWAVVEQKPASESKLVSGTKEVLQQQMDVAKGIGKGAMSTLFHAGDLIRRGEIAATKAVGIDPSSIPPGVRRAVGLERVIDNPEVKEGITPKNTAQKVGFYGEQAAEYLAPAGAVSKATKAIEGATEGVRGAKAIRAIGKGALEATAAGAVGTAQTGSAKEGAKTAALVGGTAAVGEGIKAASGPVANLAEKLYARAILQGGGKEATKVLARKIVPEAVARKVWGTTWESMSNKVASNVERAGKGVEDKLNQLVSEVDNTYYPVGTSTATKAATPVEAESILNKSMEDIRAEAKAERLRIGDQKQLPPGRSAAPPQIEGTSFQQGSGNPPSGKPETIIETEKGSLSTKPVAQAMRSYANSFTEVNLKGERVVVDPSGYHQAMAVSNMLGEFGDRISLKSLVNVRRILDRSVQAAGGHQIELAAANLKAAQKAAGDAIRSQLNEEFPDLQKVNAEFSFWSGLQRVMKETTRRKEGLTGMIPSATAGLLLGLHSGSTAEGIGTAAGLEALRRFATSTGFKTLDAIAVNRVSSLMAEGKIGDLTKYLAYLTRAHSGPPSDDGTPPGG